MPDALPDATLPISRLGTGSTNGSNNGIFGKRIPDRVKLMFIKYYLKLM
jgi:hypothetical protein